jgi:predicted MFS family arabinose efflux permease
VSKGKLPQSPKIFFGWYVVAAAFVILFFNSGARFSFGVMFKPMIADFGWNRGLLSSAFFLNMVVFAISLTVVGRFYDRYGPKWVIILSSVFLSIGYMSTAFINSFWQFFLFYGLLSAIGMGGTSVTLMAAIASKWFRKRRGLAISLALSGSCMGQFVLVPVFTQIVIRHGWRISYFSVGLIMLVINIILALSVMKSDPANPDTLPEDHNHSSVSEPQNDLGLKQAMSTYSFWLFLIAMFICGSGDFFVVTHLIPFVTDAGFSATTAGNMLAGFGLMSLVGMLLAGPASDLIGNKIPIAITFLVRIVIFILILKFQNRTAFYIFALAFGSTFIVTAPLNPSLVGRLYGFSHVGLISGFIGTIHHLGGGLWAYFAGLSFDATGNYRSAFILSAMMALIAFVSSIFIKEKKQHAPLRE